MRFALRVAGNLLIGLSLLCLLALGALVMAPQSAAPSPSLANAGPIPLPAPIAARIRDLIGYTPAAQPPASSRPAAATEPLRRPITRVAIPSIGLDSEVVDAALLAVDGGYTWQVPAFKVGHAQSTAGAGESGNAVLLGHVTSLHSGNVFADLGRVQVGDTVEVFTEDQQLDYRVVTTEAVPRTDSNVLQPTSTPSVSLITCTGLWLPTIWDYTERLVVHAELSQ
jgi:sortase A